MNPAGQIKAKELPTDEGYISVNITVKRKRQQQGGRGIEAPVATVDETGE